MFAFEIDHLAADHAAAAGPGGKRQDQVAPHLRVGMGVGAGQNLEGKGEQRVPGKDRRRLIEGDVARRTTAPHVVIVHRRQIVVDQRIGMDHFDRRAGAQVAGFGDAENQRRCADDIGPDELAAAERGIAHGVVKLAFRPGG